MSTIGFENITRNLYCFNDPEMLVQAMRLEAEQPALLPPAVAKAVNAAIIKRLPQAQYAEALFDPQIISRLHSKIILLLYFLESQQENSTGPCADYQRRLLAFGEQVSYLKDMTFTSGRSSSSEVA